MSHGHTPTTYQATWIVKISISISRLILRILMLKWSHRIFYKIKLWRNRLRNMESHLTRPILRELVHMLIRGMCPPKIINLPLIFKKNNRNCNRKRYQLSLFLMLLNSTSNLPTGHPHRSPLLFQHLLPMIFLFPKTTTPFLQLWWRRGSNLRWPLNLRRLCRRRRRK